jgi:patched 1 protein
MCFKPPSPKLTGNVFASSIEPILEKIVPCVTITPMDCFWDASKALGPIEPIYIAYVFIFCLNLIN